MPVLLLLSPAARVPAADFFVASGDVAGLAAAVDAANANDEEDTIVLGGGLFNVLYSDANGDQFLEINGAISLQGDSEESTVIQRPEGEFQFQLFMVGETGRLSISDLTITGGAGGNGWGGAVTVLAGGTLHIENSRFLNNSTRFSGGAVSNLGGKVTVTDSVFKGNQAGNSGGAIANRQSGAMTVSGSLFVYNASSRGGALYNDNSRLTVTQSGVLHNSSTGPGGGIGVERSGSPEDNILTIIDTTIEGNSATREGGGIDLHSSTATIIGTTISHNTAELESGGGVYSGFGQQLIINTTISNNRAGGPGGGIESAGSRGDGTLSLNNVTITANSADGEGGGINNVANKPVEFSNSILAGNTGGSGPSDCAGSLFSHGYNLVEAGSETCEFNTLNDIVGQTPLLGPLADNGGATRTHALAPNSPAVDAGNPAPPGSGGHACDAVDQRDAPRNCDIGAYEYGAEPPVAPFRINPGLNDAWFEPSTDGQGFFIVVFPDSSLVFLAWFTYDTERPPEEGEARLGERGHRWLTAQGPYSGDTAALDVYLTEGGVFDKAEPAASTVGEPVGSIILKWQDCERATLNYDLAAPRVTGKIELMRVSPDNVELCRSLVGQ